MEDNNKSKVYPTQMVLTIRIIVGAYVLYEAKEILSSGLDKPWYMYLAIALFLIAGPILIGFSIKQFIKGEYQGGKADTSGSENGESGDGESAGSNADTSASNSSDAKEVYKADSGETNIVDIEEIKDAEVIEDTNMAYKAVDFSGVTEIETARSFDVKELD